MKKQDIPNILTWLRVAAVPALWVAFFLPMPSAAWVCAAIFVAASITDYIDGHLARLWQVESSLGRVLDPVADKLLVACALLLLVEDKRVAVIPALVIICREILVSGLREYLAERQIPMPVTTLAKYKTAAQMVAISILLFAPAIDGEPYGLCHVAGSALLWVAAILTFVTGYHYWRDGSKHL